MIFCPLGPIGPTNFKNSALILIFNYLLLFFSASHYTSRTSERNSPFREPRVLPEWETPRRGGERNESK